MRLHRIDQNEIRQRTLLNNAQLAGMTDRTGRIDGRHFQDFVSRQHAGIHRRYFLQERCGTHLVPHIQVVVRTGTVRANRAKHPFAMHPGDRGDTARNFHVALGVV